MEKPTGPPLLELSELDEEIFQNPSYAAVLIENLNVQKEQYIKEQPEAFIQVLYHLLIKDLKNVKDILALLYGQHVKLTKYPTHTRLCACCIFVASGLVAKQPFYICSLMDCFEYSVDHLEKEEAKSAVQTLGQVLSSFPCHHSAWRFYYKLCKRFKFRTTSPDESFSRKAAYYDVEGKPFDALTELDALMEFTKEERGSDLEYIDISVNEERLATSVHAQAWIKGFKGVLESLEIRLTRIEKALKSGKRLYPWIEYERTKNTDIQIGPPIWTQWIFLDNETDFC